MDFLTLRTKHEAGSYPDWDALAVDMRLMFNNAMAFNPPDTLYHKQVPHSRETRQISVLQPFPVA